MMNLLDLYSSCFAVVCWTQINRILDTTDDDDDDLDKFYAYVQHTPMSTYTLHTQIDSTALHRTLQYDDYAAKIAPCAPRSFDCVTWKFQMYKKIL